MQAIVFDVFCSDTARGNPAAVFWLQRWPDDDSLQAMAAGQLAPVTAFICVPAGAGNDVAIAVRWFAGRQEINLCGHGSLAAAALLFARQPQRQQVRLTSQFGDLSVARSLQALTALSAGRDSFVMGLPAWPAQRPAELQQLIRSLQLPAQGLVLTDCFATRDLVLVLASAAQVQAFVPDFALLKQLGPYHALILTAPLDSSDELHQSGYVLRYFAPNIGINEDMATGSAQCSLAPYWLQRFGAQQLQVQQLSTAGGFFIVAAHSAEQICLHAVVRGQPDAPALA
ncbi:MAG: PhzF family phenazine biosynthesis protein [Rheinheimera sp.]|nr:PhzF family phenazine biosynthesis protein [Rheinheimera sp.]